ncbi:MAG: hypothetical protein K0U93_29505 [Gammaproteobacteria bacterium]|nr:hypothetical protein [Gammaproteobacteria bacterium]
MKEHGQSLSRHVALASAIFLSVVGNAAAADTESQVVFAAPVTGTEEKSARDAESALHLGTFAIPTSEGRITFLDETPLAPTPSISIVVVENSGFSTLADARHSGVSAEELFLAFAPPRTKVPERLKLYTDLLRTSGVSGSSKAKTVTTLHLHGTPAVPDVEPDNWGEGNCTLQEDWDAGFASWVNTFPLGFLNFGDASELMYVPHATSAYGYLGLNDAIWVGVCMRTPTPSNGEGSMGVRIQYLSSNGTWMNVGGAPGNPGPTMATITVGQRYLYHSFKPYTAQRRVMVSSVNEGEANGDDGNTAFISARWKDNFTPDSTEASP